MPRTRRIAPGGVVFHVINRGNGGGAIFEKEGDYAAFEKVLAETLQHLPMRLLGYCLMPNHWHLILWPKRGGELGRFMQRLSVMHVRRWHEHHKSTGQGHVYQGVYKFFPVEADEHLVKVLRYIQRNALRGGLVERAEAWRWGSLWIERQGDADQRRMLSPLPVDLPKNWLKLVNTPQDAAEEQALRTAIQRGRPFGSQVWSTRISRKLGLAHTFRPRGRPRKSKQKRGEGGSGGG